MLSLTSLLSISGNMLQHVYPTLPVTFCVFHIVSYLLHCYVFHIPGCVLLVRFTGDGIVRRHHSLH